jgi:hypothetical protein
VGCGDPTSTALAGQEGHEGPKTTIVARMGQAESHAVEDRQWIFGRVWAGEELWESPKATAMAWLPSTMTAGQAI